MTAALCTHAAATIALWYGCMRAIQPSPAGCCAHAVAFAVWWGGLFLMGIDVGIQVSP